MAAGEDETLAACYRNSLALAARYRFATVAFPAISCGVYGFPIPRACRIAVAEVRAFLAASPIPERVDLVCFDTSTLSRVPRGARDRIIPGR